MRYVAPAIESRTPVTALMTPPISPGQIPSPRWKGNHAAEGDADEARADD